ncbi:MAG TPA: pyruvate kinase [Candidatus Faecousia intestinigallinarum]|nr:pyruvate kinase [Candidatus Faecousia intestinigallinarum]
MRKTKIICTIGPASENEEALTQMCRAGMNVARLNFSHGTHAEHKQKMDLIKSVREKLNLPIAIMLDTKGPEYRIRTFAQGKVTVREGDTFTFTTDEVEGDETKVSVNYKDLIKNLTVGDQILVNNGLVIFQVTALEGNNAICRVVVGGVLSDRKSMCFPNKVMTGPYLSQQDKEDILFGIQNDVDFIAASFVSTKEDMLELQTFLKENGGESIDVIAKIENRAGVNNVEEICQYCDGIMIARGDLGVEIPFVEVPAVQKMLIQKCRLLGKRVITATEMLESMIYNPRPTRAEISDVANAVYDGSSAIMLSGESAAGKYPVEAVRIMAQIAEYTELHTGYKQRFLNSEFKIHNNLDAISHATCSMAIDVGAKGIVVCSVSGKTAMMVSRFRCPVDIIGMTTIEKVWRKLSLSWGVLPVLSQEFPSMEVMFYYALNSAREHLPVQKGDNVVLTGGPVNGCTGNTNTIKVETV